jgi:hypothetical protein
MATDTDATENRPQTVERPKTRFQLHYGKKDTDIIPGGTVLTDALIEKAKLDIKVLSALEAIEMVEVYVE